MGYITRPTAYFDAPGPANTADAVELAVSRAQELESRTIVLASTSGATARAFMEAARGKDIRLVVVTHVVGFAEPGVSEFEDDAKDALLAEGHLVVTGTHALSGLERSLSRAARIGGGSRTEAIAEALRRVIAVGMKVAVECVLIASDQGAISIHDEVVAVGGTATGADCVAVIRPGHTASFFDLQVREIVAMPRNR
ncbi:MAG: hypothetical protein D5R99_08525 [Methanocalculus sp. MSAO_Arc1]|uniref:pyruvate kinase alpha/beta domain-containing protein n=1 Tax=Methanocalculus TaxID=71151 RepID=UPI000FEF8380|nr:MULTISPECIES: pyruvate kinase alpha/beta domain-containing protein [unclassified Methanocalculus]MCP1663145.1 hypothetical protein [Methanocalculus sp. AMF5]RQD79354.1 MAG: hypothetical protein D5R99_08525 [Methanocalculus sp. MSAO_Arc1]